VSSQSYTGQSSNLQWCKENPFLKGYDQRLVANLEKKWNVWNQNQFSRTFIYLKRLAESSGTAVREFVDIVNPTTDPLPCPYNKTMKRYGMSRDSGKLLCSLETLSLNDTCLVYSLGSSDDFKFEEAILSSTGCTIHTFDCTSSPPKKTHNRLHFHKICLGEDSRLQNYIFPNKPIQKVDNSSSNNFMKFDQILKMLNHSRLHVLKMDIEGGEYSVFADLLRDFDRIDLPYQLSFESHWWNRDIYHTMLHISLFSQLWKSGYRLLHYELNIFDATCVEWTFMRMFC
jgi:hypothetical protein